MIKKSLFVCVLKDSNGYPIFSLTGELDFVLDSICKSYKDWKSTDNVDTDLLNLLENGSIDFVKQYFVCVDDNNVSLNTVGDVSLSVSYPFANLLKCDLDISKAIKSDKITFRRLFSSIDSLSKEVVKNYERKCKEYYSKIRVE